MKRAFQVILKYILPLGIGFFLLYYVLRDTPLSEIAAIFKKADYTWIFVSIVFTLVSHLARAYRWKALLDPLNYKTSLWKSFIAVMVGYFANLILPRMGEITRCAILQRMNKVPAHISFGTVVTERIIDVIILFTLIGVLLVMEFNRVYGLLFGVFEEKWNTFNDKSYMLYALLAFIAFLLILIYFLRKRLKNLSWTAKFRHFLSGLYLGLMSIKKVKNKKSFIFFTLLIWVGYFWMSYVLFFTVAATSNLGLVAGFTILIMGGIGMAAPVQGGIGAYHYLVSSALSLYGISKSYGISFATFMHTTQTAVVIIFGGACFLISLFIKYKKKT